MRFTLAVVLIVAAVAAARAEPAPGPVGAPTGPWRAQIHWVPLDIGGTRDLLYTRICRPAGEQPARVVVFAHGSPAAFRRPGMKPVRCNAEAARWFLSRGFVVLAGMRRGFGRSAAPYAEGVGGPFGPFARACEDADYLQAGLEAARDLAAMVEYAAALPFARSSGMVVVGQSAGGWATIAYDAMPHPRVTALVNMAGGRGGHLHGGPNQNCRPDLLAEAAGRLARTATTPMLWVYTANDSYFAPSIAAAMYAAYRRNGGRAEFVELGPFLGDGHRLFLGPGGSQIWGPLVEHYLASRPAQ
jgi:dienelactone hydrolase